MTEKTGPTKIAVIRCDIVSETCPGVGCFKAFNERKLHFEIYDKDAQMIAFCIKKTILDAGIEVVEGTHH